ncbi:MAG: RNA polymerase sigma factor [Roseburia sp.]|nr:RNA polymerase sigma factor [Roseburia sp.]
MLEKIIRKYYDEIFRYCCHHVESRAAAEDLCQDTFVSFIEHWPEYGGGRTKPCLYTIARNKCTDYYRKRTPIPMETVPETVAGELPEEAVVVRQMVAALPEELREAVILRYFQGLKYTELAAVMGISSSLAKYRVRKGLEILSEMEGGAYGTKRD